MAANRREFLLQEPIGKALLYLAIPITLGNALQSAYLMIDAFWVGRLGRSAVAAVAVSFLVTFLTIALGSGLGIGSWPPEKYCGFGIVTI
jgi:Na+-driven multidrug efflux pump